MSASAKHRSATLTKGIFSSTECAEANGTLDQQAGRLHASSDAAMCSDVDFLKAAGFNTLRNIPRGTAATTHIATALRWLVWQDQVSQGTGQGVIAWFKSSVDSLAAFIPRMHQWPDWAHKQ